MLIGHEKLTETFKHLAQGDRLSHGYLFFGEPNIGKFSFAMGLAAYLETGEFREPSRPLGETTVIRPDDEGTIGISSIREAKYFLTQKPVYSSRRVIIIDEAEKLTLQAQHAILIMAEEPPPTGLIILVVSNQEALLPTIQSRLQKIYFPRVSSGLISTFLIKQFKISQREAAEISKISFGRPGRAIKIANSKSQIAKKKNKKELIEAMTESNEAMQENFTELIAELAKDPVQNYAELKSILNRLRLISQFNTNKRLQLESALWNI